MPSTQPQITPDSRIAWIKGLAIALLLLVAWPLPSMISFISPEPVVLGRYALKYFLMMASYLAAVLAWFGVTWWLIWHLNNRWLELVCSFATRQAATGVGVLGLLAAALVAIRSMNLSNQIVFPGSFGAEMRIVPSLALFLLLGLAAQIINKPVAEAIESRIADIAGELSSILKSPLTWERRAVYIGIGILVALLATMLLQPRFWSYPLTIDSSLHLYLGQHVLRGGIPYRTFIYFYPPLRFLLSILWSLGAQMSGLPTIDFVRGLDAIISAGMIFLVYLIGRDLTGRRAGGLLAAALLFGTEHIQEVLVESPTFAPTTALLILMGVWLAQRERWFWAGVVSLLAAELWTPAIVLIGAIGIAALLQAGTSRTRAFFLTCAGGLLIVGITIVTLLATGLFKEAYEQSFASVLQLFVSNYLDPQPTALASETSYQSAAWYYRTVSWLLRGDWEIVLFMVLGIPVMLAVYGLHQTIKVPQRCVVLLAALLMALAVGLDLEGSPRETIMALGVLAPVGAGAIVALFDLWSRRVGASYSRLRSGLAVGAFSALLFWGAADSSSQLDFIYSLVDVSLEEQRQIAADAEAVLTPDETVLVLHNLWYLNLSNRDNVLPFRSLEYKTDAVSRMGWTLERTIAELKGQAPSLILGAGSNQPEFRDWLENDYIYMGNLDPDRRGFPQSVYVCRECKALRAVIAEWPLTD